ncbi:39kDa subunit of ndufa9, NADH:ubiquinone oxidoreductase [Rhizophlyctis rosea]|uniref:39kDa subunit of ndufa9, NADH:ubiquinone oxidoreductase n=1 Tax=Rhizophlyctis rosea TaxID=64517 RepID=A0AAD5SM28_9FUNG|nr:39kDa subunit of ndufa9, NADH:ubiquinone oxidoreductase [Rhizophlyctis rosea]
MLRFAITRAPRQGAVCSNVQKRGIADITKRAKTGEVFVRLGPGGRSSTNGHIVTVFGATGFLGRYLVNNLGKQGTNVVIPYRGSDDDKRHLKLMGDLGQIVPTRFDIRDEKAIIESIRHSDVVFNLIGQDWPTKNFNMVQANVDTARTIARLCRENGVSKLVHLSALNADENSSAEFYRVKALGEKAVREEFPEATIVRPATLFGYEDRFWNRLGWLVKYLSIVPVFNAGATKVRPTYVGDVAHVLGRVMKDENMAGKTLELAGPREYYWRHILQFFLDVTGRTPTVFRLPRALGKFFATMFNYLVAAPVMTAQDVERLYVDDKFTPGTLRFEDFNVKPHTIEETVIRFAQLHRSAYQQRNPYDPILSKYTTEHHKKPLAHPLYE